MKKKTVYCKIVYRQKQNKLLHHTSTSKYIFDSIWLRVSVTNQFIFQLKQMKKNCLLQNSL